MALPSQTERSSQMSRPVMGRPSSGGTSKPVLIALGLVLAAGAVYGVYRLSNAPASTIDPNTKTATLDQPKVAPPGNSQPVTPPNGNQVATADPKKSTPAAPPPISTPVTPATGSQPFAAPTTAQPRPSTPGPGTAGAGSTTTTVAGEGGRPGPVDVSRPDLKPQPTLQPAPVSPVPDQTLASSTSPQSVRSLMEAGDKAAASGKQVDARVAYSRALLSGDVSGADAAALRDKLTSLSNDLLFSARIDPADPLVEAYTVQPGDALEKIRRKRQLATEWMLIQRINKVDPRTIKIGQKLKLVRGPFHAVVHKNDYRLDLFAGSPDEPETWVFIRSFQVGLGAENTTPEGRFVVRAGSKLVNPEWVNPRTGEHFAADDPKNPIGERWIGLDGVGDAAVYKGYGIHGTIDPTSIGKQASMGCVRLGTDDVALMYELLIPQISVVRIEK